MEINWEKIEICGSTYTGEESKIYLEHLPRYESGANTGKIKWGDTIGCTIPFVYGSFSGELLVKDRVGEGRRVKMIVDIVGFYEVNFKINIDSLRKCSIGTLVNNVYANPNYTYRQLVIDSVGEECAKEMTFNNRRKIKLICPNCGYSCTTTLNHLNKNGLSCPRCSDGISYPEKLLVNVLSKLRHSYDFTYERQFSYDGKHNWDVKLTIGEIDVICEVHGAQHYIEVNSWSTRTLEEEKANDMLKRNIALSHGVLENNYHEIDCRYSALEWCRENIENTLRLYFDMELLTDEDWLECDKLCQKSLVKDVCERYRDEDLSIKEVAEVFNISYPTAYGYIVKGSKYGWCTYNKKSKSKV